ncbi:MAG: carboxypeptidase-like regulatory domain-containing protein [Terracidiphilus sp.]
MSRARYKFLLLPLFLVLACAGLWAQANSEVTGIVTDQTGAVVAGAKVVLTDPATGEVHSTVSGGTGLYDISGLNPFTYNMKVTAKGFEAFQQNGIVVNVSSTDRVDVKLTIGAETQTITVEADALAVQADSNVVSSLINSEQISEIATENRNFAALAALGLGVSSALPDSNTPGAVGSNFTIQVNGLRQSHNIWLIDGGESDDRGGAGGMQIQPSQDAIAEFTMMTSNYPPDYGISSGATMSLSLKSGTQKFHGELWEENRNTDYDANSYFNNLGHTPRPAVHYNIYGWGVGGPVFIPKVYNANREKTFFYWNEEWRKTVNLATSNNNTIDPADIPTLGTDLKYVPPAFSPSTALVVPKVPLTSVYYTNTLLPMGLTPGDPFPNNTIPHQLFDPNFVLYLQAGILPKPSPGQPDKAIAAASLPFKVRDDIVRIDHRFSDKWAILGHYIGDTENENFANPELGWCWCNYNTLGSTLSSPSHSAAIKLSGTINPNLLVEASINYDGNEINITPSANSYKPSGWNVSPVVSAYSITRKTFPGISGFGNPYGTAEDTATEPYHNAAQDYEPKVDISFTVGKHATKYGFSWNRYTKNQMLYSDEQGDYGSGSMSNDGIMDLLMGIPTSYSQSQSAPIRHYVNNTPSVYVMDNWHVTPRLSLQLGIRYDALPHAWERNNFIGNFVPGNYVASQAPIWDGSSGVIDPASPDLYTFNGIPSYINGTGLAGINHFPRGAVTNDYKTEQPRIGFSEDLFGNGRTVLRGGFGTFFERMQGNDIYGVATSAPFNPSLSLSNVLFSNPGTAWDTGAVIQPTNLIFAGGAYDLAKNYRAPAVAQFSLGVQHELRPSVIWVVQYVGNLAWHQNIQNNINNFNPTNPAVEASYATGTAPSRPFRCIAGDGSNNYNTKNYPGAVGSDTSCNQSISTIQPNGGGNAFRYYPGYTGITQSENDTNGNYNGFQTGVRVQNRWGLSGELDYTWSHEIDLTSYDLTTISNPWNYKYDRGSGALDRRQILSANYIYKLPFLNKGTDLLHSIAGGWEFAGTVVDETGTPAVVNDSLNYDPVGLNGGYTVRPNLSGGKMSYTKKMGSWFNTANFAPPVPYWLGGPNQGFGNAGKDAVAGPGRVNFTTSLYKSFAITERAHFELRFESFNTFNHTEANNLNTGYDPQNGAFSTVVGKGNTFGQVTGTWDPRVLELGGKFVF